MTDAQTEARAIAQRLERAVKRAEEHAGMMPARQAVKIHPNDWHAVCDLAREAATALAARDAARDEAVFLKDCAEAALVKRESELVAKNAELAAVKENCETVCNSYADENQRLYDRAERAEAELAEMRADFACQMKRMNEARRRAEAHLAEARKAQNYLNDAVFAGLDHLEIARRAKILVNAARRAREQGGE